MEFAECFSRKILFLLFLTGLIVMGGCWDAKEIQNLALVNAVAIDYDETQPDKVMVTIQIIKPGEVKSAGGGGDSVGTGGDAATAQKQAYVMAGSTGKTISEAFRNFVNQVDRELYLSDNQIIVFGKETARKGIYPYLDFFIRTHQPRETNWIVVADGKAADAIKTGLGLEKIPAWEINQLINNRELASQAAAANIHNFVTRLSGKISAPYTSLIKIQDVSRKKKIALDGTAVFKGDKYIGQLDKTETRGFLWVINKVKRGIIPVKSDVLGMIDFDIIQSNSKMEPEIDNGKIIMKLTIETSYKLSSELMVSDLSKREIDDFLERLFKQAIRREVYAAFHKAIQLKADLFGLGEAIHRRFPREWQKIKPDWEQVFLTARIQVQVKSRLVSAGLISGSVISQ